MSLTSPTHGSSILPSQKGLPELASGQRDPENVCPFYTHKAPTGKGQGHHVSGSVTCSLQSLSQASPQLTLLNSPRFPALRTSFSCSSGLSTHSLSFSSQPQVLQTRHSSCPAGIALALVFSIVSITASPHCSPSLQQDLLPQSSYQRFLEGQAYPSPHAQHLSSTFHLKPL